MKLAQKVKAGWEYIQGLLDINGDVIMLVFSVCIVWKILHAGLNASDAAAYATAVTCFAYSNRGKKP